MTLSEKHYELGQWFIRTFLPAFITLYLAIDAFFNLPKETEVTGSLAAVGVFVGALLASSSRQFKRETEADGGVFQLKGIDENGMPHIGLDVKADPASLMGKKRVTLTIDKPPVLETTTSQDVEPLDAPVDTRPPWQQGPAV